MRLTKEAYGWDPDRTFYIPDEAAAMFSRAIPRGESWAEEWAARFERYREAFPAEARELERRLDGDLRPGATDGLKTYAVGEDFATRQASQAAIQDLAGPVPELFGGAADLSESNLTDVKGAADFSADEAGRNLRFGVREHAMGGIANGIAYHGGFIAYAGTFLNFSDYMRGSVRLAALAGLHVIYVWTHDSVGLGEDGPTHQPVEHYAALRAIPNLWFIRPGDANETSAAWAVAVTRPDGPVALALTRQKLATLPETAAKAHDGVARGGYVVRESSGGPESIELILLATGSELPLVTAAADSLAAEGIRARVVSLPCWELFDAPAGGLPRRGPPAADPEAAERRVRGLARLGALRRRRGRDRRDRPLRGERPGGDDLRALRLHRGARRRGRPTGRPRRPPRPGPDRRPRPPARRPPPARPEARPRRRRRAGALRS